MDSFLDPEEGEDGPPRHESLEWNVEAIRQTCIAVHTKLATGLLKGQILEQKGYLLKTVFDTLCEISSKMGLEDAEIAKKHYTKKLEYLDGTEILCPPIDIMLRKNVLTRPDLEDITAIQVKNLDGSNEPGDTRTVAKDMARLAYLTKSEECRWGFYIWVGRIEELKKWDLKRIPVTMTPIDKSLEFFLNSDLGVPHVGKPVPSFCTKIVVQNQITPELCVRAYRIEAGDDVEDFNASDVERLEEFYTSKMPVMTPMCYGSWNTNEQLDYLRVQIMRARHHFEAELYKHALAVLSSTRILFLELLSVKKLEKQEKDDAQFLQSHFMHLKERIVKARLLLEDSASDSSDFVESASDSESESDDNSSATQTETSSYTSYYTYTDDTRSTKTSKES